MPFNFNLFSGLLLPAFLHGIIFSVLLFVRGRREERLSDTLLGWLLLLLTIKLSFWMLGFAGWFDSHDGFSTFMFYFPFSNVLLIGPLLYFYFLSLTNADFKFKRTDLRHFILPAIYLFIVLLKSAIDFIFYHPFAETNQSHFGTKGPWADILNDYIVEFISYGSFIYYLFLTTRSYKKYQTYVEQNFSTTEPIAFSWIKNILYASAMGILIFLVFEVISLLSQAGGYVFFWYPYLALGVIIYYISIAGYQTGNRSLHQLHFQPDTAPIATEPPSIPSSHIDIDGSLKNDLQTLMATAKPYLDPELSLAGLSKQMGIQPSVLSKLINEKFNQNFNDFINEHRVNEVIEKIKKGEHRQQTLLGIAFDAGFNSKATFNRAFKKFTSVSPKDWIVQFQAIHSPE